MAHFAELDDNDIVLRVIVISNDDAPGAFPASEAAGRAFIAQLGLPGRWMQASYNGNFRGAFPGPGCFYDKKNDVFTPPQPFPSWTWDGSDWQPPTPMPESPGSWEWDEDSQTWILW